MNISFAVLAEAFAGVIDRDSVDPLDSSPNQVNNINIDHESSSASLVMSGDEVVDFSSMMSEDEIHPGCDDSMAMDATDHPLRSP